MSAELRVLLVRHAESTNNDLYRRTGSREGRDPDPRLDEQCMPPAILRRRAELRARLRAEGAGVWLAGHGVDAAMISSLAGLAPGRVWQRLEVLDHLAAQRLTTSTARTFLPDLRLMVAEAEARKAKAR